MEYFSCADFEGQQDVIAGTPPDSLLNLITGDVDESYPIFPEFDDLGEAAEIEVNRDLNLGSPDAVESNDGDVDELVDVESTPDPPESSPGSPGSSLYEEIPFFADGIKEEVFEDLPGAPVAQNEVVLDWDGLNIKTEAEAVKTKIRRPSDSQSSFCGSSSDEDTTPSPLDLTELPKGQFNLPLSFGAKPKDAKDWDEGDVKKPRMSYAQLIAEALMNSPDRRLTLNDIYVHINARHPFYSLKGGKNWQNAIRHNLTLNKSFVKVPRPSNEGRGSYWELEAGAEKSIFKRLLRQHYMYKVALDAKVKKSAPTVKVKAQHPQVLRTFAKTPQIKIIKSVTSKVIPKVNATVSSSSSSKPTIIYVTLPKSLFK